MRILYCTPRPFGLAFGGSEVQLLKTKESVERLGHEVRLADYFDHDLMRDIDVVHLFGSDYVFSQLADLVSGRQIPLVVSSIFYPVGGSRWRQAVASRLPKNVASLRRSIMRKAQKVLPNSESEASLLQTWFGVPQERLLTVPNGVDASFVGGDPTSFRRTYLADLPETEPFVMSVGRIERRKNTLNLIRAAAKIKAPLVLVGRYVPNEASYCAQVRAEIDRTDTYIKHIEFLPPQSADLANAYAAAHVHALTSWLETPGLASLEAGLNGANLVVGDCKPVREYFRDLGFLVDPGDVSAISAALAQALALPRNHAGQSQAIASRYTWKEVAAVTVQAYESAIRGG